MGREPNATTGLKILSTLGCLGLLIVSGCPGSSTVVNWPSERLDNNPSTQPVAVEVFDIDGDGAKDVVSAWRGSTAASSRPGAIAVHFQEASGQWSTTTVQANTKYSNVNGVRVADINLDGRADILVANHDRITYLRAPANPRTSSDWTSFDLTATIGTQYKAWFDVAAAQIDGANGLDIVATLNDDGRLVWFASPANLDSADGWTLHSIDSTTRRGADTLALIDLSGDGRLDVVCSATGDTNGEISWYEQPTDPAAGPWPKHVMTTFESASRFALGDLDGDGLTDLAAISPSAGRVAWFPHPADVTGVWNGWVLADYTRVDGDEREPVDVGIADMDGNGRLDVVVAAASPASLFWYTPGEDIRLRWDEHRIAAISNIDFALFDVEDTDGDNLPEVVVPVDQANDNALDRIDRFINPVAVGTE